KGYEWWLALDAQLHRQAQAAGLPAKPLPDAREVLINFRGGPRTFQWVPYYRVVTDEFKEIKGLFSGKIVLIGSTSEAQHDVFATAFARAGTMPGVEIHANALETFIRVGPALQAAALAVLLARRPARAGAGPRRREPRPAKARGHRALLRHPRLHVDLRAPAAGAGRGDAR